MYLRECNNFYLLAVYILQAGVNYLNRKKKLKVRVCGFNAYRTRIFSIIHEPVRKSFSFIFDYVPNLIRLKVTLYWNSYTETTDCSSLSVLIFAERMKPKCFVLILSTN